MKWKRNYLHILIIPFGFFFLSCNAQNNLDSNLLQLMETIELPGVSGRIDHLSFDNRTKIVFVAALGNNTVEAVDLKSKKVVHTIKGLNEPQGVVFIPEDNALVVANGGSGECMFFNAALQKTKSIQLVDDADNVRYDKATKKIYVGYGSGGIAVIDVNSFNLVNEIKFSGHPESFQINQSAKKMYVNVPDEKEIVVIDLTESKIIARWKLNEAGANFPMALDDTNHRLFIGCRHSSKLLALDSETGKMVGSVAIDGDTDDVFYDASKKQIYVSCGRGYIDVIKQNDANNYNANGRIRSNPGARTSLFIPELNLLIVGSPASINSHAQLMIYKTN